MLKRKENIFSIPATTSPSTSPTAADVVKVKGKALSARDKKKSFLPDRTKDQGQELLTISDKVVAMHSSYRGKSTSDHEFEVKGKFTLMDSKRAVTFKNASDGSQIKSEFTGDSLGEMRIGA